MPDSCFRHVVLVITLACTGGCTLALVPPTVLEGRAFSHTAPGGLVHGMDMPTVEALLGTPWRTAAAADSTRWTYYERRQIKECRRKLFGIPLQKIRATERELTLTFTPAGLERAAYHERTPDAPPENVALDLRAIRPAEEDWDWLEANRLEALERLMPFEADADVTYRAHERRNGDHQAGWGAVDSRERRLLGGLMDSAQPLLQRAKILRQRRFD